MEQPNHNPNSSPERSDPQKLGQLFGDVMGEIVRREKEAKAQAAANPVATKSDGQLVDALSEQGADSLAAAELARRYPEEVGDFLGPDRKT